MGPLSILLPVLLATAADPLPSTLPLLVDAAWLQRHLDDPDLVVAQIHALRRDYARGHLPGARFLWSNAIAPSTPDGSYDLPTTEQAEALFRDLGIGAGSRLVLVHSGSQVPGAARALLTFEHFGLRGRVALLDGGIDAWKTAGGKLEERVPQSVRRPVKPVAGGSEVVDANYIRQRLGRTGWTLVDARTANFFQGDGGGQPRGGHLPGAVNLPFTSLLDGPRLKPREELVRLFAAAGIPPKGELVTYCHVGQQASLVWLAARLLGYEAKLYDGSFEDWSGRPELPLEKPAEAGPEPPKR
jgi:thiosulfate/3-mercaptopyruvate sulfurtransferase